MDRLSRFLPPFASDYTGVAAVLFDLGGMTVLCDAGCCTDHYVLNDEPRWRNRQGLVFSVHLRSTEAVLGSDRAIVERVCTTARQVDGKVPFVALLGTPVPGIVGMDLEGVAAEVECELGVPALGFATAGFKAYDAGLELAMKALAERFGPEPGDSPRVSSGSRRRVNLLGASPLDFGDVGNDRDFAALFSDAGWEVGLELPMGANMERLARVNEAQVNLAVSAAGLKVARWLERRCGTPWVAGCPLGETGGPINRGLLRACEAVADGERPSGWWRPADESRDARPTLVIADQVVAESLRALLELRDPKTPVVVASPFGWDAAHAGPRDFRFASEQGLIRQVEALNPAALAADPLFEFLALGSDRAFAPLVHCAVSGKLHWDEAPRLRELTR